VLSLPENVVSDITAFLTKNHTVDRKLAAVHAVAKRSR
jgi:hypothetical protein